MKIIEKYKTDIICIQEPYIFKSNGAGILKKYNTFTSCEGRCREKL
jgi:hypothetical protein